MKKITQFRLKIKLDLQLQLRISELHFTISELQLPILNYS